MAKTVLLTSQTKQVIDKAFIVNKLHESDGWLYRGIKAIFDRQTADEQCADVTAHSNGVGFNGVDAGLLSSFAKQLDQRGFLTAKQKQFARTKMTKYAGQLLNIALSKHSAGVQV